MLVSSCVPLLPLFLGLVPSPIWALGTEQSGPHLCSAWPWVGQDIIPDICESWSSKAPVETTMAGSGKSLRRKLGLARARGGCWLVKEVEEVVVGTSNSMVPVGDSHEGTGSLMHDL